MREIIVSFNYNGSNITHINSFNSEEEMQNWLKNSKKKIEVQTIVDKSSL